MRPTNTDEARRVVRLSGCILVTPVKSCKMAEPTEMPLGCGLRWPPKEPCDQIGYRRPAGKCNFMELPYVGIFPHVVS